MHFTRESKNRYCNILPRLESRVPLEKIPGLPGSDYINADRVPAAPRTHGRDIILTQAPVVRPFDGVDTRGDLFRMIWEQRAPMLICIHPYNEGRAEDYLPTVDRLRRCFQVSAELTFELELTAEEAGVARSLSDADGTELARLYRCTLRRSAAVRVVEERALLIVRLSCWPDFGVPTRPCALLELVKQCASELAANDNRGAVVMHCKAGAGRAGTLCAVWRMWEASGARSCYDVLREIRAHRRAAVQTSAQYALVCLCGALLQKGDGERAANVGGATRKKCH